MNRNLLIVLNALTVLLLVGCNNESVEESRKNAYEDWAKNRAKMFSGMAVEHLKVGELDKARTKAAEAVQLAPANPGHRVLLGQVLIEDGKYTAAQRELEAGLAESPDSTGIEYCLGVAFERQGLLQRALEHYRRSYELDHTNLAPVLAAAEVTVQLGKPAEALASLEEKLPPADPGLAGLELCGRIALMCGDGPKAVRYFQKALALKPKNPQYQELLAKAYFLNENFPMCRKTLNVLRSRDGFVESPWMLRMEGDCALAMDERDLARRVYRAARDAEPNNPTHWTRLAKLALLDRNDAEVIRLCNQARRLEATDSDANLLMAYALLRQGRSATAVKVLHQLQTTEPGNVTMYCLMGRAYESLGKHTKARQCYEYARYLQPDCTLASETPTLSRASD